jgi:hypothetical protein
MTTAFIGQPISRVDGRQKVTGGAKYAAEFHVPGLAHAAIVRSTIAKGRITSIRREGRRGVRHGGRHASHHQRHLPRHRKAHPRTAGHAGQATLRGDVVRIPPGQKHWHGASPTTGMTHIAIQEHVGSKNVDWMEHVSDEQYGR